MLTGLPVPPVELPAPAAQNAAPAATTVEGEIVGLYVAAFGIATSGSALSAWESWAASHPSLGAASSAISTQGATVLGQLFVSYNPAFAGMTDSEFVSTVVTNMSGANSSDARAAGVAYWANQIGNLETNYGLSSQAARGLVLGALVDAVPEVNLQTQPPGLSIAQYQTAVADQAAFHNKVGLSVAYAHASSTPAGAVLDYLLNSDAAPAAVRAVHEVTADPASATNGISHIQQAVAAHDLLLI